MTTPGTKPARLRRPAHRRSAIGGSSTVGPQGKSVGFRAMGILASIWLAVILAGSIYVWLAANARPRYSIDPASLSLTAADVGPQFDIVHDSPAGPTQRAISPPPYQSDFVGGHLRVFMTQAALTDLGAAQIADWERAHGFTPTDPPTILGPFVADHSGIFEIDDVQRSYQTADAAHLDYACCTYNREEIFHQYHTIPVQLGAEADAFTGLNEIANAGDADLELQFTIHWRHGPIVSVVSIAGSHDITFDQALHLALIDDQRITQALQSQPGK